MCQTELQKHRRLLERCSDLVMKQAENKGKGAQELGHMSAATHPSCMILP